LAVHCGNCGEELLGAVNRCWKCGTASPADVSAPTTNATPTAETANADDPIWAEIIEENADFQSTEHGMEAPIANEQTEAAGQPSYYLPNSGPPRNRLAQSAIGGAIGSVVLGLIGLVGSFFSVASLVVSTVGFGLGLWGLISDKKALATVGLIICLVAILVGGYQGVRLLYDDWKEKQEEEQIEFESYEQSNNAAGVQDISGLMISQGTHEFA
jgi:hypothetical protein